MRLILILLLCLVMCGCEVSPMEQMYSWEMGEGKSLTIKPPLKEERDFFAVRISKEDLKKLENGEQLIIQLKEKQDEGD